MTQPNPRPGSFRAHGSLAFQPYASVARQVSCAGRPRNAPEAAVNHATGRRMCRARWEMKCVGGETKVPSPQPYAHLFSPWQIRHTKIANRVIFGPVCPTWVR